MANRKSGVKINANVKKYNFNTKFSSQVLEHAFTVELYKALNKLGYEIKGGFVVVSKDSSPPRICTSKNDFKCHFTNIWSGEQVVIQGKPYAITKNDIFAFIESGHYARVDAEMPLPLSTESLFVFDNKVCLNNYVDYAYQKTSKPTDQAFLWEGLQLFAKGLCGIEKPLPRTLFTDSPQKWEDTEFYPFLWVIHWFAILYQRPGINLRTVPAFIGAQGVGKGQWCDVMAKLYGSNVCGEVLDTVYTSQSGFNSELMGKIFCYANEIKQKHSADLYNWIKNNVVEEYITFHPKGKEPFKGINILNLALFTNDFNALHVEGADRRISFLQSYTGPKEEVEKWRYTMLDPFIEKMKENETAWLDSLSDLFLQIDLSAKIYNKPLESDLKEYAKNNVIPDFDKWMFYDKEILKLEANKILTLDKLYAVYKMWAHKNEISKPLLQAAFANKIKSVILKKEGYVSQKDKRNGGRYVIKQKWLNKVKENTSFDENEAIPEQDNSLALRLAEFEKLKVK